MLVFLPGWEDIVKILKMAHRDDTLKEGCYFLPMHSQIPKAEQAMVFQRQSNPSRIKVVLATNIAETSVTIPDISFVIDSCKQKMKYYKPVHDTADPAVARNTHSFAVQSAESNFECSIAGIPTETNPATGALTPLSTIACLRGMTATRRVGT